MSADTWLSLWQYPVPQHLISRLMGLVANSTLPMIRDPFVDWFIRRYGVDMSEAANANPRGYHTFNEFFTRPLRDGIRPVAGGNTVVSPSDGTVSELGDIRNGRLLQAKGHSYTAIALLGGDESRAAQFDEGHFITVYLAPKDYHRVHMPLAGTLREMIYVPGRLFSVNARTARGVPGLFARNERVVCIFDTIAGPMALVLVGAIVVAGIATAWAGTVTPPHHRLEATSFVGASRPVALDKGAEMGRFLVGSTAIVLLPRGAVHWDGALRSGTALRMGQAIGALG